MIYGMDQLENKITMDYLYYGTLILHDFLAGKNKMKVDDHSHTVMTLGALFSFNVLSIWMCQELYLDYDDTMKINKTPWMLTILSIIVLTFLYYRKKEKAILKKMENITLKKKKKIMIITAIYWIVTIFIFYYLVKEGHDMNAIG